MFEVVMHEHDQRWNLEASSQSSPISSEVGVHAIIRGSCSCNRLMMVIITWHPQLHRQRKNELLNLLTSLVYLPSILWCFADAHSRIDYLQIRTSLPFPFVRIFLIFCRLLNLSGCEVVCLCETLSCISLITACVTFILCCFSDHYYLFVVLLPSLLF